MNKTCILEEKIKYILKFEYKIFLNKDNVVGVALGYKRKNGFYTCQKCIQVFVKNKIPEYKLSANALIPSMFKGIPTDVVESGIFKACSLKKRVRPVLGGYGISAYNYDRSGTAGCLVTNGVSKFVLATNHTLAGENRFNIGTPIIEPAHQYGGFHPNDTIATLHKYIPLRFIEGEQQPLNFSDCALGLLSKPDILSDKIAFIGKLKGIKTPTLNEEVRKVGLTSELTEGIVTNTDGVITVHFFSGRSCLFHNLIFTTASVYPGDSGAILVNKHNYALGMAFGGSENFSNYCKLDIVLDQLDVKLVT